MDVYVPNNWAIKYLNQKLVELKEQIDLSEIIDGDFNTPLPITGGTTRQKISKDTENSTTPSTNRF